MSVFETREKAILAAKTAIDGDWSLINNAPVWGISHDWELVVETISGATDWHTFTVRTGKYQWERVY